MKFEALPKFKKRKFNVKRFMRLAEDVKNSMLTSEQEGWHEMKIEERLEWLKDKIDKIYETD